MAGIAGFYRGPGPACNIVRCWSFCISLWEDNSVTETIPPYRGVLLLLALGVAGLLGGCTRTPPSRELPRDALPATTPLPATYNPAEPFSIEHSKVGLTIQGRVIGATVYSGGEDTPCVLIIGGIHGSEPSSTALVEHMGKHLREHPEVYAEKTVVLIPRANPDGLAAAIRYNARGIDLNRNFPTPNFRPSERHGREALSEPETLALVKTVRRYAPSTVVSVHAPLGCIDPDGGEASTRLAHRMAAVSPLPYKDLPALPGSMGSYVGVKLGRKMITYELDRKRITAVDAHSYLDKHLAALLLAIAGRDGEQSHLQ